MISKDEAASKSLRNSAGCLVGSADQGYYKRSECGGGCVKRRADLGRKVANPTFPVRRQGRLSFLARLGCAVESLALTLALVSGRVEVKTPDIDKITAYRFDLPAVLLSVAIIEETRVS